MSGCAGYVTSHSAADNSYPCSQRVRVIGGTVRRDISSTTRHKRWLILLMSALVFALGVYINRERLKRAVIAYRIYRAHVFTPPPSPGESQLRQLRADVRFYWDFSGLQVARDRRLRQLDPTLRPLVKEIGLRQAAGEGMQYSMHIYREIRWRLNFTPDIGTTRARIADLRRSLAQPGEQKLAAGQQASDGSWGRGLTVWFLKLYYSVEDGLHSGTEPRYPLSFLDRINSPEKLTAQLDSVLHDDFTKTGAFNREELDETFSGSERESDETATFTQLSSPAEPRGTRRWSPPSAWPSTADTAGSYSPGRG